MVDLSKINHGILKNIVLHMVKFACTSTYCRKRANLGYDQKKFGCAPFLKPARGLKNLKVVGSF